MYWTPSAPTGRRREHSRLPQGANLKDCFVPRHWLRAIQAGAPGANKTCQTVTERLRVSAWEATFSFALPGLGRSRADLQSPKRMDCGASPSCPSASQHDKASPCLDRFGGLPGQLLKKGQALAEKVSQGPNYTPWRNHAPQANIQASTCNYCGKHLSHQHISLLLGWPKARTPKRSLNTISVSKDHMMGPKSHETRLVSSSSS